MVKHLLLIYSQVGFSCILPASNNRTLTQKEQSHSGPAIKKQLNWSSFSFNSTQEESFWAGAQDWTGVMQTSKFSRNQTGEQIDNNNTNPYSGYARQIDQEWELRTIILVKNGWVIKTKSWDKLGRPRTQRHYKNGKLHGRWTGWHGNGQKQIEFTWANGVPVGQSISWHKNGNISETGNYRAGKMHGEWIAYQLDGRVKNRLTYNFGEIITE
jgi:antitoxin component YwqK of YwqJK toxin-antitoxin module